MLITGGASSRLGFDKAELRIHGETLAHRAARMLLAVCHEVVEVGPGYTALDGVCEEPQGGGPLAAFVAGANATSSGPWLLLAVDLPFVDAPLLEHLARWPGNGTVMPRVGHRAQRVCARYGTEALEAGRKLLSNGQRSLRALEAALVVTYLDEPWNGVATESSFRDVDTPADAAVLGLEIPR